MELVIEKDIPVPQRRGGRSSRFDSLLDMEVGDSVALDNYREAASAQMFLSRHERVMTMRKQEDGTYRLWRIV
jgi:hypothetical protein